MNNPADLNIDTHKDRFNAYYHQFSGQFASHSEEYEHLHLKWLHSLNVLHNAEEILQYADFPRELRRAGLLAALYHDVARFEQYIQYDTFRDALSANHGLWGSKILKREPLLAGERAETCRLVRAAVGMHNRAELPARLPEAYRLVTGLVRDADKIDILRVLSGYMHPEGPRSDVVTAGLPDIPEKWSPKVYAALMSGQSAIYQDMRFLNDFRLLLCTWLYGLNFPVSLRVIAAQGHMPEILEGLPDLPEMVAVRERVYKILLSAEGGGN